MCGFIVVIMDTFEDFLLSFCHKALIFIHSHYVLRLIFNLDAD